MSILRACQREVQEQTSAFSAASYHKTIFEIMTHFRRNMKSSQMLPLMTSGGLDIELSKKKIPKRFRNDF